MPVPGLVPNIQGNALSIAYETDVDNVDLFADLGSPAYPVHAFVLVADGVTVGAALNTGAAAPDPALLIEGFAAGSTVYLLNRGTILGGGGIGGQGDRGFRPPPVGVSTFVGGGGGGGAGSSSQGGVAATESSPFDDSTDGAAGTTTTGGAGGDSDFGDAIGVSGFVEGAAPQFGGAAIVCRNANLIIDNTIGEIFAGGNGGDGGWQDGTLPGGANDAEDGEDLPASVTFVDVDGNEPAAVYHSNVSGASGYTLTFIGGDTYPSIGGYVREVA